MKASAATRLARWLAGAAALAAALVVSSGSAWAGPASQLVVVQQPGDVTAGTVIAPHFIVRLRDADGNDVTTSGVSVSAAISSGTGSLLGTTTRDTDANGSVEFDDLAIQAAGSKQLTASSGILTPALSASFAIDAAAPANLAFDVEPSNAVAGVAISPAVRARVTDSFGNPVASELVSMSLSGGGTLSGTLSQSTDGSGIATFPDLSVDLAGTKQLHAASGSLGPVPSASFDLSPAAAANLAFDVQPSNTVAGVAIAPAVRAKVTDSFGNGVETELVSISLTGGGTLSGTLSQSTDGAGIATFPDLSVNLAGSKQLHATSGSLGPISSTSFTISAAAAANLTFDVPPGNAVAGVAIAPAVRAKVTDGFGNGVASQLVSMSLTGGGTLAGTLSQSTDGLGLATFPDLSVDLVGSKQLHATSGSLGPVSTNNFTISHAAAANLRSTCSRAARWRGWRLRPPYAPR